MTKALFLDRDGIINIDHGYVYQIESFEFVDGIFEVCQHAMEKGYQIFVITNQAGIARGYYTINDFEKLTSWMTKQFEKNDVIIDDVYFCPHHPSQGVNDYVKACKCRKPQPGMILQAQKQYQVNLQQSIFIGDKVSDIKAAEAAGIDNRILLASKYHQNGPDEKAIAAHKISQLRESLAFIN